MAFSCRVCNGVFRGSGDRPYGWFKLHKVGDDALNKTDPRCGFLCSMDCLAVSVLGPFGLSERQVRDWLGGDP
jgi:hypothetical protein